MATYSKGQVTTANARVGSTSSGTFTTIISAPASPALTRMSGWIYHVNSSNVNTTFLLTHTAGTDSGQALRFQSIQSAAWNFVTQAGTKVFMTQGTSPVIIQGGAIWALPGSDGPVVHFSNFVIPPGWFFQARVSSGSGTALWALTEEVITQG